MTKYIDVQVANSDPADPSAWTTYSGKPPFEITGLTNGVQYRWRRGDTIGLLTPRAAGGASAAAPVLWETFAPSSISIRDGGITARVTTDSNRNALAGKFVGSGKFYFEILADGDILNDGSYLGVATVDTSLTHSSSTISGQASFVRRNGAAVTATANLSGALPGPLYQATGLTVVRVAVDKHANRLYVATADEAWSSDPAAGGGDINIPSVAVAAFVGPRRRSGTNYGQMTLRSRAVDFSYAPPAGFAPYAEI
jgi:hypothetical protein